MENNNKTKIIIVAAILLAAFFMPWISFFASMSAWDMVFGTLGQAVDSPARFLLLLIPIAGILIIYSEAFNKGRYQIPKSVLYFIPILTLIIMAILVYSKMGGGGSGMGDSNPEQILKVFGIGFWLTLIGSIVLPFLRNKNTTPVPSSTN